MPCNNLLPGHATACMCRSRAEAANRQRHRAPTWICVGVGRPDHAPVVVFATASARRDMRHTDPSAHGSADPMIVGTLRVRPTGMVVPGSPRSSEVEHEDSQRLPRRVHGDALQPVPGLEECS